MARIVHVSATIATGIYTIICTVAKCQLEAGHEVFLVGCTRPDDSVASWLDELPKGVRFIELSMEREIIPSKDWSDMWALRRTLQEIRPDAIHLHSSKAGALGRVSSLFLGAGVVYQANAFAFLRKDVSAVKRLFFGGIEAALSLLPGRIVASSESERVAARRYIFLRRIDLVNNSIAVPPALLEAGARRPAGRRLKVGMCARVSPQKDPLFFAEVVRRIGGDMEFVWIGGGIFPEGQQALDAAGVRTTGVVGRDDALLGIADLDLYIQTSAW
ncbi:MAG: glycosyltransferase, partial [Verrucomicrobia bacterium]|nr:glycosyltransferase [Verrucomicrobiota bacterium]